MKLLLERWKKFLNEDNFQDLRPFKDIKKPKCWGINTELTKNFTRESRFECIGTGNNKIVFKDSERPDMILKLVKTHTIQDTAGDEVYVWEKLKNTPFSKMFAEIEPIESGLYYMKKSQGRGSLEELEEKLFEISEEMGFKFKDLEYYMLGDANQSNIGKIDGQSVLLDYDDFYTWIAANRGKL